MIEIEGGWRVGNLRIVLTELDGGFSRPVSTRVTTLSARIALASGQLFPHQM